MRVCNYIITAVALLALGGAHAQNGGDGHRLMPGIMAMPVSSDRARGIDPRQRRPVRVPLNTNPNRNAELNSGGYIAGGSSNIYFPDLSPMYGVPDLAFPDGIPGEYGPWVSGPAEDGDYFGPAEDNVPTEGIIDISDDLDIEALDLDSLKMMSRIGTAEEFAALLGFDPPPEEEFANSASISARFGGDSTIATVPTQANCATENATVKFRLPRELNNVIYFPTCVRLPRCSGCCTSSLLKCQPTQVTKRTYKLIRVVATPSSSARVASDRARGRRGGSDHGARRSRGSGAPRRFRSSRRSRSRPRRRRSTTSNYYVDEVEHNACECQCRVKAEDCNPSKQVYVENTCTCVCSNQDEEAKCDKLEDTHFWDNNNCTCKCNKVEECSTTQYFDHGSCSCVSRLLRGNTSTGEGVFVPRGSFAGDNLLD